MNANPGNQIDPDAALPPLSASFVWTREPWGIGLCCGALMPLAHHLFTTKQLRLRGTDVETETGLAAVAACVNLAPSALRRPTQVHGRAVAIYRRGDVTRSSHRREADIVMTDDPGIAVAIEVADCVPLLIADPETGAVAAVHAGWRGTAVGLAGAAVEALGEAFGSRPSTLVAALGPSIGPCCYMVGEELIDRFRAAGRAATTIEKWFVRDADSPPGHPPRDRSASPSTLRLNLWQANVDDLLAVGLLPHNVHVAGLCTARHLRFFYSYRAEGAGTGRMLAVIRPRGRFPKSALP